MIKTSKNTILTIDGKVLFFGIEDYMDKIANGDCCFICGAEPNSKEFNNEHILVFTINGIQLALYNRNTFRFSIYNLFVNLLA